MTKYRLEEVCELITDGTHQTPEYCDDGGVVFLTSKDVTEQKINWNDVKHIPLKLHEKLSSRLVPRRNDILLAKNGTTGVAALVDSDEIFDIYVSLALLRPLGNILPRYLLYAVNSPVAKRQFNAGLKGIGVPNLHLSVIRKTEINVVPYEDQLMICDLLEKVSHVIELRKCQLNTIDELIKARFVEMFENDLKHTELTIGDIAEEATVGIANSATHAYSEAGIVMLRNQNIRTNYLDDSDLIYITSDFASKYKNKALKEGDILITRTGVNVGMACIVPSKYEGCQTFTTLILRLKKEIEITPEFVCYYINSPLGKGFIDDRKVGGAQPNFGARQLITMPIVIPDIDKQKSFASFVKQVDKSKSVVQKALDETKLLFDSLMQEYFG